MGNIGVDQSRAGTSVRLLLLQFLLQFFQLGAQLIKRIFELILSLGNLLKSALPFFVSGLVTQIGSRIHLFRGSYSGSLEGGFGLLGSSNEIFVSRGLNGVVVVLCPLELLILFRFFTLGSISGCDVACVLSFSVQMQSDHSLHEKQTKQDRQKQFHEMIISQKEEDMFILPFSQFPMSIRKKLVQRTAVMILSAFQSHLFGNHFASLQFVMMSDSNTCDSYSSSKGQQIRQKESEAVEFTQKSDRMQMPVRLPLSYAFSCSSSHQVVNVSKKQGYKCHIWR